MPTLQAENSTIQNRFAQLLSKRILDGVEVLWAGAILSSAERTVTATLQGLGGETVPLAGTFDGLVVQSLEGGLHGPSGDLRPRGKMEALSSCPRRAAGSPLQRTFTD